MRNLPYWGGRHTVIKRPQRFHDCIIAVASGIAWPQIFEERLLLQETTEERQLPRHLFQFQKSRVMFTLGRLETESTTSDIALVVYVGYIALAVGHADLHTTFRRLDNLCVSRMCMPVVFCQGGRVEGFSLH